MSGLGTGVPNGIVPLLSFWSFSIAWGTIVPINAFPFRVAVPLCWHEERWFPINYVPFFVKERLFLSNIVPALKNWFLFIHLRNNCSINGSALNEIGSFLLARGTDCSYLCKMVPIKKWQFLCTSCSTEAFFFSCRLWFYRSLIGKTFGVVF